MLKHPLASLALASVALLPLAGCDTLGLGSADEMLTVSFGVPPRPSTTGRSAAVIPITVGAHTLDLLSVDVTLDRIVIERVGREFDDEDDGEGSGPSFCRSGAGHPVFGRAWCRDKGFALGSHDDDDGTELRAGAITVALPLAGGTITPINTRLPDGSYDEIELKLSHIRARGTFDGQPFDLTLFLNLALEIELDPVFVVDSDDDRLNITIAIDPLQWWVNLGQLIDPRTVQLNPTLRRLLEDRIRASFRVFEDEDRDADDQDTDTDKDRGKHKRGKG